jgi:hypothetical protein
MLERECRGTKGAVIAVKRFELYSEDTRGANYNEMFMRISCCTLKQATIAFFIILSSSPYITIVSSHSTIHNITVYIVSLNTHE